MIISHGTRLSLYRIINPLANQNTVNKYPVLYGHGVLYDASSMISRSEHSKPRKPILGKMSVKYPTTDDLTDDHSLPFMFSNNNFDVWLFDARGVNDNGRNITETVNPEMATRFWDFSLDEQALLDVPSLMDYVLTRTGARKLVYVGYSESTFFMFALMSEEPSVADKVAAFIALAPVAYVAHIQGLTFPLLAGISALTPDFVQQSFVPQPVIDFADFLMRNICRLQRPSELLCGSLVNGIGGLGTGQLNPNLFLDFFKATSIRAVKHFVQLNLQQRFAKYDFGLVNNLRSYGQPQSPNYELAKVKSDRIILVRGLSDFLADPKDQERLLAELGTKPYLDIVIPEYNHFDFIDGQNLIKLVNHPAMTAVFELMYRDGSNILVDEDQLRLRNLSSVQLKEGLKDINDIAGGGKEITDRIEPLLIRGTNIIRKLIRL